MTPWIIFIFQALYGFLKQSLLHLGLKSKFQTFRENSALIASLRNILTVSSE